MTDRGNQRVVVVDMAGNPVSGRIGFGGRRLAVTGTVTPIPNQDLMQGNHRAACAFITVEGGPIRFYYDGRIPSATEGHRADDGDMLRIEGFLNVRNLKLIRAADAESDAVVEITYERRPTDSDMGAS